MPRFAATMRPARRPARAPPSITPRRAVTAATPTAASADQRRAATGVVPAAEELRQRLVQIARIPGLERHLHLVLGIRELRIGAEEQQRKVGEQLVQVLGERPLADRHEDVPQMDRLAAKALAERVELRAKD